ncbi:EAL domain-containing protein [Methylobacterium sp. V23]|uniref:putative bifunctional diguanylate cyclase/phosphodiesterase n=1 Tax=Methylobacterium sp. V23 TaxID=2044878 RepID=UPI000CDA295C|nr:EAL domain-containing protein [Methylobacterium sp. V23]POR42398.1 GGDEF-domain containing protein [Methylobacterium sp. V23]
MSVSDDEVFHGDASDFPDGDDVRFRQRTRTALLRETLQLANFSAVTQAAVVVALAWMFWGVAPNAYLIALAIGVTSLCAATFVATRHHRSRFRDCATPTAVRRGFLLAKTLSFGLGLVWSTMPAMLLPTVDNAYRVVVVAVCAGLISDAYVVGPIFSVAILLVAPVVAGAVVGLAGTEAPVGGYIAVLLVIYATFVFSSARRICRLSYQRILDRLKVQEQNETIGLLLNDFAEGASDWLWETDNAGRLRHAHVRIGELLGIDAASLRHRTLAGVLQAHADDPQGHSNVDAVVAAIEARAPFRDRTVRLRTPTGVRWWRLNGKPVHDEGGTFLGYRGVGSDTTAGREAQARIAFLAGHDTLTGLPNRAAFQEAVQALCDDGVSTARSGALFYIDLDGFKAVNDERGHRMGDRLLKAVARRMTDLAGPDASVFRLGGDEFAVIVTDAGQKVAEALAGRIVSELRRAFQIDDARLDIGASVGIAYVPDDAVDPESLLMRADLGLYSAKAAGKGRWQGFDPSLEEKALRHRQLDADMRVALAADEMELHYQPLVDMRTGRVTGFEALLRWNKPGHGWVSPGEVIPIAEATGFVVEIGRWALRRACADARMWADLRVAVNISSIHVRMPAFHEEVAAILRETGLAPENLEIEITESVLLDHGPEVLGNLKRVRAMGVRIALDDFGTGYSSLSYLTEFPFDKVKVDRSFVRDLQGRPEKVAVVEAIARMARALSMNVTVEGVETQAQLDVLRAKRCDIAQGFLYSPARPAGEIMALIERIEAPSQPMDGNRGEPMRTRMPTLALVRPAG